MRSPEPFFEPVSCFANEQEQFILRNSDNLDVEANGFLIYRACNVSFCNKQPLRQRACATVPLLQQAAYLLRRGTRGAGGIHFHTKNAATRRVHQAYAIKVAVSFGDNRRIIEPKSNPRIVDLKLIGVKHELHYQ